LFSKQAFEEEGDMKVWDVLGVLGHTASGKERYRHALQEKRRKGARGEWEPREKGKGSHARQALSGESSQLSPWGSANVAKYKTSNEQKTEGASPSKNSPTKENESRELSPYSKPKENY
jgi:hypothetical protein